MTDLLNLIESGQTNLIVQVRGEDLLKFTEDVMERAAENERRRIEREKERETLIPKEKVMSMLDVCSATLWHWEKSNYLVPIKAGRKVMYRQSDIDRIIGTKNR